VRFSFHHAGRHFIAAISCSFAPVEWAAPISRPAPARHAVRSQPSLAVPRLPSGPRECP
jgi:hypothetical protein